MAGDSDIQLISARPTVRVNEMAYPLLSANIISMRMRETLGGMSTLEICFVDSLTNADGSAGFGATSGSPLKLGAKIKLYAGATEEPRDIFQGLITAIEGEMGPGMSPTFTILAEDLLWKARKARRTRTFDASSPADIVRKIAKDHNLTVEVRDGLDQPKRTFVQMNESDLAFLRRVLAAFDADLLVVGDKLQAGPAARDKRTKVELQLDKNLVRARVTADLADQATEVRIGSFDPATGHAVIAKADKGELGPGTGSKAAAALRDALGDVREHVGHEGPLTQGEADTMAKALFGRRARRFVRVDATAQGDANIRVGSWVGLTGINPFFQNDYTVIEATHRFDNASGYLTDFIGESAFLGTPA